MRRKWFAYTLMLFPLVALSFAPLCRATIVTFDDLSELGSITHYVNLNYQGLVWSNWGIMNAVLCTNIPYHGVNGFNYGIVSASNVANNAFGNPAEISAVTNFDLLSAYLTGAWNSNLNVEVKGFSGQALLYDTTVIVSATAPTLFTFNYLNVNRLEFSSFGGQDAGFSSMFSGDDFVMDNFTFEFVPEPSSFLLTAAGALTLWSFVKRKRA